MAVVFLLDLDNTLIDNDAVREQLNEGTRRLLGAELADRFWTIYEEVRDECDYVDFLETLDRFHRVANDPPEQQRVLDRLILDFPYPEARYPATLDVLAALWKVGTPVVLSDGDPVFQPLKVFRSGVSEAVRGNVLVFPHKETSRANGERGSPRCTCSKANTQTMLTRVRVRTMCSTASRS